jgi:hypothetical protein
MHLLLEGKLQIGPVTIYLMRLVEYAPSRA